MKNKINVYLLLVSRIAVAVSDARSSIPTTGFVTVPTTPFPSPAKNPCFKNKLHKIYLTIILQLNATNKLFGT